MDVITNSVVWWYSKRCCVCCQQIPFPEDKLFLDKVAEEEIVSSPTLKILITGRSVLQSQKIICKDEY